MAIRTMLTAFLPASCFAHEYLRAPPARTDTCKLNAVVMGDKLCKTTNNADAQCLDDPLLYSHLFHLHPYYETFACGGATTDKVQGWSLQSCSNRDKDPNKFNMTLPGPEAVTKYKAGSEVELRLHGFFHQGVNRIAICFRDDHNCNTPSDFNDYVLGFHFTEGTAGAGSDIYTADMPFKVKLPNRNGRAVLQWLVDAEDVRSYVSCSDVELTDASFMDSSGSSYVCNGHPLCNCTTSAAPVSGHVGLGRTCPQGTAASVKGGQATGTDIVKQYKDQVGVEEFCKLCLTNGCPSTCGGIYKGFYEGKRCTNKPILPGCGSHHETGLPRYVNCTKDSCTSFGWLPSSSNVLV